jgi:hypothetical protein
MSTALSRKPYRSGILDPFLATARRCVEAVPARAESGRMSKTPANPPPKPNRRQPRCVAGIPERGCSGGMKKPPANQPMKPKPRCRAAKRRHRWVSLGRRSRNLVAAKRPGRRGIQVQAWPVDPRRDCGSKRRAKSCRIIFWFSSLPPDRRHSILVIACPYAGRVFAASASEERRPQLAPQAGAISV